MIINVIGIIFRKISSAQTITLFSSTSDHCDNTIGTKIIRRPGNSISLDHSWGCYFHEISESDIEGGRDIFVDFHCVNGSENSWSRHYYRPFHLDRESKINLKNLVSDKNIVRWHTYYNGSCSSPLRALNFRSPTNPEALAGCYVTKLLPAKNNDLHICKATVPVNPGTALETPCSVSDCRVCRTSRETVFNDGDYINMDFSPYRFVFDVNEVTINLRFLPILERAYSGNIVLHLKRNPNILYLAVSSVCSGAKLKFIDFFILFRPIPTQTVDHGLTTFFRNAIASDHWIQTNDDSDAFVLRDPIPTILLHQARHLILLDFESPNADPTVVL